MNITCGASNDKIKKKEIIFFFKFIKNVKSVFQKIRNTIKLLIKMYHSI